VPTRQILFCTPKGTSFLVRFPQPDDFCTALTVKNLRTRPPLRPLAVLSFPSGRYMPSGYMLFCTPKGTSFLVRLPQADDISTALTVKNLRPRLRPLAVLSFRSGRYVPTGYMLFCTPKGTSFLVRFPQPDGFCTALTVKNLRTRPLPRPLAVLIML
jgi:nitrous oxide reductase accessory protein NosL